MSRHSFDPAIAESAGLNAAVIYQNLLFWCERNAANGRNIHDGNAWTYNSKRAFSALFPYLSIRQIRTALDKLEEIGLVSSGCYNTDPRDRTKWYAVHDKTVTLHLSEKSNGVDSEGQPLPDSKPDNKQDPHTPKGADLFSENSKPENQSKPDEEIEAGFKEFWEDIWPRHVRKTGKADCLKVYTQACEGKHPKSDKLSPQHLNRAARAYIASVRDPQFIKGTLPWLRLPGWEPFLGSTQAYSEADLSEHQKSMLGRGKCPPSLMENGKPNAKAKFFLKKYGYEEKK
jgi:hypothetical protein